MSGQDSRCNLTTVTPSLGGHLVNPSMPQVLGMGYVIEQEFAVHRLMTRLVRAVYANRGIGLPDSSVASTQEVPEVWI